MKTDQANQFAITPENIDKESFYNLCKLSDITGYADPIGAIRCLSRSNEGLQWVVTKDKLGNIVGTELLPA